MKEEDKKDWMKVTSALRRVFGISWPAALKLLPGVKVGVLVNKIKTLTAAIVHKQPHELASAFFKTGIWWECNTENISTSERRF